MSIFAASRSGGQGWEVRVDADSAAPILVATIVVESDRYSSSHALWQEQQRELFTTLARSLDASEADVDHVSVSVPGTRGTLDTVLLQVLSPAGLSAAVAVFKVWLSEHSHASLNLDAKLPDGRTAQLRVEASGAFAGDVEGLGELITQLKT